MCGRYTLEKVDELGDYYGIELPDDLKPNYNAAPTQIMPVITEGADGKSLELMKWGFSPPWLKGYSLFNTKSEEAFQKNTWKKPIQDKRCIIPASAFYEWRKEEDGKHPFYIHSKSDPYLSLAGLWNSFDVDGVKLACFSILTTSPNNEMESIHNRMPVVLEREDINEWLNPDRHEEDDLKQFLVPLPDNSLQMHEVSKAVNVVKNNNQELILPLNSK